MLGRQKTMLLQTMKPHYWVIKQSSQRYTKIFFPINLETPSNAHCNFAPNSISLKSHLSATKLLRFSFSCRQLETQFSSQWYQEDFFSPPFHQWLKGALCTTGKILKCKWGDLEQCTLDGCVNIGSHQFKVGFTPKYVQSCSLLSATI